MKKLTEGFGLLEGARWYPSSGLVFSDMIRGGVYSMGAGEQPAVLIPHRKGIGGLVAHADGGFVISGRNVAHKRPPEADSPTPVLLEAQADEMFFNDLTADAAGRVYVGSIAHDPLGDGDAKPNGRLYRIDLDGSLSVLAEDVHMSNGIATSPDNTTLYHADTYQRVVWAYPIEPGNRSSGREVHIDTSEYDGLPDGIAVDDAGSVWVAMAGSGVVVAWDNAGRRIAELAVPQPLVTTLCFGAADRRSLFVLTGSRHSGDGPEGGCVYLERMETPGTPTPLARVHALSRLST